MTQLRWIPSVPASGLHALSALVAGRSLANPALQEALAEPAAHLKRLLADVPCPADAVFTCLSRAAQANSTDAPHAEDPEFREAYAATLIAFDRVLPYAARELELRVGPLREQWEARGPGLLHWVGKRTDRELIVSNADVVLMYPVLGGGGRAIATLPATVTIEAVLANPVPDLPEVVRLGWLLAQARRCRRSDSEFDPHDRIAKVRSLALLPAVLAAAEDVELVRSAHAALAQAIEVWHLGPANPVSIHDWWQRYQAEKPAWETALRQLEQQLG